MKSSDFKVVFFGTSEFAQVILQYLLEAHINVVAVVTRPDRPTGRHLKVTFSPVKNFCLSSHPSIPLYQPEKVSTPEFEEVLLSVKPDLCVVTAFGEIIKKNILQIPAVGSINVHPSLLPKYRGPSPLQTALLHGDTETGVCIIDVAEKMDAGVIFAQETFEVDPNENFDSLQAKALAHSKKILIEVVKAKKQGTATGKVQDETRVSFCKKITSNDEKINWEHSLDAIHNHIRALSEKPGAWSYLQLGEEVKRVKIYASALMGASGVELNSKKHLYIQKNSLILKITSLQVEGKKRLSAVEFLSGLKTPYKFI